METNKTVLNKILIITYYWPPSGGGGVQRWVKFCKYLPEYGFEPIVLTVAPSDASYTLIDNSLEKEISADLKVYTTKSVESLQLFMKLFGRKKLPHSGFSGENKATFFSKCSRFVRGNFFIPDPRKGWNKFAQEKAVQLIKEHSIKYVITTSPPHSTQLIGSYLKKRCAIEWFADLRDPWTDIYYYNDLMHTSIARKIDAKYELEVLEQADQVLVVSPAIQRLFASKITESKREKINVLPNGYDEQDVEVFPRSSSPVNQFVITYTGNLASNYPGDVFLNVLKQLIDQNPAIKIIFRFVGVFPNQLNDLIHTLQLETSIEHIEYVEHSQVFKYLNTSDALFLAIPEAKNNEGILTGKLFEYLATNKPIVCIGPPHGDAAAILHSCSIGKTFDRGQEKAALTYLQALVEAHQQTRHYFSKTDVYKKYSRKNLTKELVELMLAKK